MKLTGGRQRIEVSLLWLASLLITIGIAVYVVDRGAVVHLPLGNQLPTFVHPFAFILITAAVLQPWPRLLPAVCAGWFALETAFEFGQRDPIAVGINAAVPGWFAGVPWLEAIPDYFARGTYDPLDVLSIALGTLAAYGVVRRLQGGAMP